MHPPPCLNQSCPLLSHMTDSKPATALDDAKPLPSTDQLKDAAEKLTHVETKVTQLPVVAPSV